MRATPKDGSYRLHEYPGDMVELACDKCGRSGRLSKAHLVAEHGADASLPNLRLKIARCEWAGHMSDPCGAYYPAFRSFPA